jgi:hypothetical protein
MKELDVTPEPTTVVEPRLENMYGAENKTVDVPFIIFFISIVAIGVLGYFALTRNK